MQAIRRNFPAAAMVIIYGSTEAGPVTMLRPPDVARKPTSVGRPALNVDVRLVDARGEEVGVGQAGEILCRSDCAGLCPGCGKNLNEEPHTHDEATTDPRWSALERLREKL